MLTKKNWNEIIKCTKSLVGSGSMCFYCCTVLGKLNKIIKNTFLASFASHHERKKEWRNTTYTSQNRKKRKQIDKGTWSTKFNSSLVNWNEKKLVGNIYFFKLRKRRLRNSNQHFNNNNFPQGEGKLEIANNHF